MNSAVRLAAKPVQLEAAIDFLSTEVEHPFVYAHEAPLGGQAETARFTTHEVQIQDVRDSAPLRLEEHGATLGSWPTRVRRFYDAEHVRRRYYPESAEVIKSVLGADRVVVFDHNVRRGNALQLTREARIVGRPVHHAHTDYTPRSALQRLRHELGPQAENRLSRYLQVNLWRPIRAPLRDAPLAICDGASLARDSLRMVELRYSDRIGEIYYLLHELTQRWYFASDMRVDEAWLFKNFDAAPRGPGGVAPHSAFKDPRHPRVPPRESIEVRALAIFH